MTYDDSISYIHSLLKFGIHPGLSRMDSLLNELSSPQKGLKYVHVAGTNGKGSVSTAVSNILIEAGYNVGLYTSPYVTDFLERVQYNGKPVEKRLFSQSVEEVKRAVEKLNKDGVLITEFEALTAAAFLCYKKLDCDIVVLEVGLGGRLDATNVIDVPLVNIITSLSLDHTAILGDTVEKIAFEKCGTLKDGGTVVLSASQPEGAFNTVKRIAKERNNTLVCPEISSVITVSADVFGTEFIYKDNLYKVKMPGAHQILNMTSAIEAARILAKKGYHITEDNIKNGIFKTVLPARCEVIAKEPLVILDGGHNEDGAKAFYSLISAEMRKHKRLFVIAGMMRDKAVEKSLSSLIALSDAFFAVTPENPRAMSAQELFDIAKKYTDNAASFENANDAVRLVSSKLESGDVLCVVGSLYLAGEVRRTLKEVCEQFVK